MGFVKDFKTFASKGNLPDIAIGLVLAGAFGKVIDAFVKGMVMPIVGLITGGSDFLTKKIMLSESTEVKDAAGKVTSGHPENAIMYGAFIAEIITFLAVALVCYMIIKKLLKKDPNAVPALTPSEALLTEIRDSLKK